MGHYVKNPCQTGCVHIADRKIIVTSKTGGFFMYFKGKQAQEKYMTPFLIALYVLRGETCLWFYLPAEYIFEKNYHTSFFKWAMPISYLWNMHFNFLFIFSFML